MSEETKKYKFFVDAKQYETEKKHLTGTEIKGQAAVNATYQLFLEEEGDTLGQGHFGRRNESTMGRPGRKHFFAVPPATFGLR